MGLTERHWFENEEPELTERQLEDIVYNKKAKELMDYKKEVQALRLLVEWAVDCGFGFDNFPNEYERYKNELTGLGYIENMIYVAKRTIEDKERVN